MAKQGGLGAGLAVGGFDLSGDITSIDNIHGGPAALDCTSIAKSAVERLGGLRDGGISVTSWMDMAAGGEHVVFSSLPLTDIQVMTWINAVIGGDVAACVAKQSNYDGTRGTDGSLTSKVDSVANGFGLEWGNLLTPGHRVDSAATASSAGNAWDTGASLAFGAQVYIQLFAFTGTSVTIKVQDSADDSSFADVSGLTSGALTTAGQALRVATANNATIRRYLAVATTGTFSNADFAVMIVKNPIAGVSF